MWRSDVTSLFKSAASTIASYGEAATENLSYYVDVENVKSNVGTIVSAVGGAVIATVGTDESGASSTAADGACDDDLESYKQMLHDTQMQHVTLSKELSALIAAKDKEIFSYKEKYGQLSEEDLKSEKISLATLLLEKERLDANYQQLETNYLANLSKVNEAVANTNKLKSISDKYSKLIVEYQQTRESFEIKDKGQQSTIESLVSEYSQLSADVEKKNKQLKEVLGENERLEIKLQALENNICEFADRAANVSSSANASSSSSDSNSSVGSSGGASSSANALELKDLRTKVLNLQYDLRERDLSIASLKEQLELASSKRLIATALPSVVAGKAGNSGDGNSGDGNQLSLQKLNQLESELSAEKEARLSKERSLEKLQDKLLGLKSDIDRITIEKKEAECLAKDLHDKYKKSSVEVDGLKKTINSANTEKEEKSKLVISYSAKVESLEAELAATRSKLEGDTSSVLSLQVKLEQDLKLSKSECDQLKLERLEQSETLQRVKDQMKREVDKLQQKLDQDVQSRDATIVSLKLSFDSASADMAQQSKQNSELKLKCSDLERSLDSSKASEKYLQERNEQLSSLSSNSQTENDKIIVELQSQHASITNAKQKEIDQLKRELAQMLLESQTDLKKLAQSKDNELARAVSDVRDSERTSANKSAAEAKENFESQLLGLQTELLDMTKKIATLTSQFESDMSRVRSERESEKSRLIVEKDEILKVTIADLDKKFIEEKHAMDSKHALAIESAIKSEREISKIELENKLQVCNSTHEAKLTSALEALKNEESKRLESAISALESSFKLQIDGIESENKRKSDEFEAIINKLKSDLQSVESRFEIRIKESVAQVEKEKKEEFDITLNAAKAECNKLIEAAKADRDEYVTLYTKECKLRKTLHNKVMEFQGNIRVFCRVRPVLEVERRSGEDANVTSFPGNEELVVQKDPQTKSRFEYDKTFPPGTSQELVFESVQPLCISALDGFNVCIFAYGQTGSGKTYTMDGGGAAAEVGVSPRCFQELFKIVADREHEWSYVMNLSMLEIYNESILDLLNSPSSSSKDKDKDKGLDVRQGPEGNVVPGLTEVAVADYDQIKALLVQGQRNRAVGSHDMNEHSSRSHSIITVTIKGKSKLDSTGVTGKLHLIDLAGSERVGKTDATGDRLKEAQNINRSLSALGDVIHALGEKSSAGKKGGGAAASAVHIPYRNSKLTFLLQDSLGGNSKVLMFVNISPAVYNVGESLCSLQFASRCRAVELGQAKRQVDSKK